MTPMLVIHMSSYIVYHKTAHPLCILSRRLESGYLINLSKQPCQTCLLVRSNACLPQAPQFIQRGYVHPGHRHMCIFRSGSRDSNDKRTDTSYLIVPPPNYFGICIHIQRNNKPNLGSERTLLVDISSSSFLTLTLLTPTTMRMSLYGQWNAKGVC